MNQFSRISFDEEAITPKSMSWKIVMVPILLQRNHLWIGSLPIGEDQLLPIKFNLPVRVLDLTWILVDITKIPNSLVDDRVLSLKG